MSTKTFPVYVQSFFTERLNCQLQASPHTIASYRDTFRLLLKYASEQLSKSPTKLEMADIDGTRRKLVIKPTALAMLTDGIDLRDGLQRPWYELR